MRNGSLQKAHLLPAIMLAAGAIDGTCMTSSRTNHVLMGTYCESCQNWTPCDNGIYVCLTQVFLPVADSIFWQAVNGSRHGDAAPCILPYMYPSVHVFFRTCILPQ